MRIAGALALVSASAAIALAEPQTFRSGTQVVTVHVSVTQGKVPLGGLVAADFELRDNDVPQKIEVVPSPNVPIDLTLIIGSSGARLEAQRIGPYLKQLVSWLTPSDRIQVLGLGRDVREVFGFRAPADLPSAGLIAALATSASGIDPTRDPTLFGAPSYDAILLALTRPVDPARRSLILRFWFEGTFGNAVPDGSLVADVASRSDSVLYVAYAPGETPGQATDSTPRQYELRSLTAAANATGGTLRHVGGGVGEFRSVLNEFRQSYVLRYAVAGVPTSGWHTIAVRIPGRSLASVRARNGYLGR